MPLAGHPMCLVASGLVRRVLGGGRVVLGRVGVLACLSGSGDFLGALRLPLGELALQTLHLAGIDGPATALAGRLGGETRILRSQEGSDQLRVGVESLCEFLGRDRVRHIGFLQFSDSVIASVDMPIMP